MKGKDVVYIDIEDEITAVIDKVVNSSSKVVALVLPKRAAVFQSIVNLKLLKKKADSLKKNVVLVTSDKSLLPMAGVVGLHVARTLQDQPTIPSLPEMGDDEPIDAEDEPEDTEIDSMTPIGELAGLAAVKSTIKAPKSANEEETIEIDNTDEQKAGSELTGSAAAALATEKADKKAKKDKKLKVPNFNKFRNLIIIGILVIILLVVGWVYAYKVLPKATITIETNTSNASSNLSLTLSSTQTSLDPVNDIVPAKIQTSQQTETSPAVNTTGTKTVGTAATGTITLTYPMKNSCGFGCQSDSIPAGTIFTDPTGTYSYQSDATVTIPGCNAPCKGGNPTIPPVQVTAVNVGSSYNIAATNGYSSSGSTANGVPLSSFNMSGSAMTGGSSQQVQVVAQADVTSAQNEITAPGSSSIEQGLESSLEQAGLQPITQTFVASSPAFVPSAAVGAQANSITVTATYNYSMYGVKQSDLATLVTNNVTQQIDPATQGILDSGVSKSTFAVQSSTSTTTLVTMTTNSTIGPKLSVSKLLPEVAGKLSGDIKSMISQVPGVTSVSVKYSPFWVTSTPKNVKKITINIEKTNGSTP